MSLSVHSKVVHNKNYLLSAITRGKQSITLVSVGILGAIPYDLKSTLMSENQGGAIDYLEDFNRKGDANVIRMTKNQTGVKNVHITRSEGEAILHIDTTFGTGRFVITRDNLIPYATN